MWRSFFWVTPVVKRLLIINTAVFLACALSQTIREFLFTWFSSSSEILGMLIQPWRLLTYQFLHQTAFKGHIVLRHIFGNMIGLFFFGRMLEHHWGSRRFLIFYLVCGAVGGALYPLLASIGLLRQGFLIGASGAISGVIAAAAILFPRVLVYIWGILPIPLMLLAALFLLTSIMGFFGGSNAGGQVAHLAGMAVGAAYVLSKSWRAKLKLKMRSGTWERKIAAQRNLQAELDRVLQKVHDYGIHSLTSKEKKILKQATEAEQMRNRL